MKNIQKISKNRGITLIALIVTIIILMILAGIVIATVTGNNEILSKSKLARETYKNSANEENDQINGYENEIDKASINVASSREKISEGMFIDTSKVIATVGQDTDWSTNSYEYTATEDCIIAGRIGSNGSCIYVYVNDVNIGLYRGDRESVTYSMINIPLKKGDKIKLKYSYGRGGGTYVSVYAYGIK